jgi:hypothetical protein
LQNYPSRPIRFIVPFPPGGGTDTVARLITQPLSDRLQQQIVIDNRSGANAIIGTDLGAKSLPDGYTLVFCLPASVAVNPTLYPSLPYDPIASFAPVALVARVPNVLVVHPAVPAKSVQELIALAKAKPGSLRYASGGNGSAAHLAMEYFKLRTQTDIGHIPYKGPSPAVADVMGGQVEVIMTGVPAVLQQGIHRHQQHAPSPPRQQQQWQGQGQRMDERHRRQYSGQHQAPRQGAACIENSGSVGRHGGSTDHTQGHHGLQISPLLQAQLGIELRPSQHRKLQHSACTPTQGGDMQ